ncbi:MAG TPA: bifunctional hydroxymethylpyrimidine kinase/phosphomethylpyrimidine kinase [Actinomycetota bacterium]|nr:bifunctional hydroxymethylpyrimidine kinase/phosphomethylpyrimidine kinase [Actinomycetota bacterium]
MGALRVTEVALSIAGSDSGGGAGIQQDLKVFEALGVWGATAVTAITVQDTHGVRDVHSVPWELVAAQIDAVAADLRPSAAKTGMLPDGACVRGVCDAIERHRLGPLVVDPVLAASDGTGLMDPAALDLVRERLVPLAAVITPNLAEAAVLTGLAVDSPGSQETAARALVELGAAAALVTGGHLEGDAIDILFDGETVTAFPGPRIPGGPVHGTGCVLSAAITAGLARGRPLRSAVGEAKELVTGAIERARSIGGGARVADAAWRSRPPHH